MPQRVCRFLAILLVMPMLALPACQGSGQAGAASPAPRHVRLDRRAEAQDAVANATRLKNEGNTEEALAEFEHAIEVNPTLTIAYIGAADLYRQQGDFDTAEQRYRKATEVEPSNFDAQYGHGLVLQLLNRVAEAIRAYLRALAIRPDDFDANLNVATAYMQVNEPRQARPYAERAVRLEPDSGPARVNLGAVYAALDMHDAAVIEYQQAAELMELGPELLLNLADSLGKIGRYAEMAATLDQLVKISPSAPAYERLGSALFRQKNYDQALAAFQQATEIDPGHFPAWNGVGVCLLNQYLWSNKEDGRARRGAIEALRRSLQIQTNQPKIIELLRRYDR
ncbi:MAG: tetratricopeptide repeat protein [Phycisphaeraceae bacterium]|nr:MAG: tetratricopeptide repeat protein [Phycisphaeraceae bacterium]